MRLAFALAALLLAGCGSTRWVHTTKSEAEFQRDRYDCEQVAYQYAANLGQRFAGNPFIVADEQLRCLQQKHGWMPVRGDAQSRALEPSGYSSAPASSGTVVEAEPSPEPQWCKDRRGVWTGTRCNTQ